MLVLNNSVGGLNPIAVDIAGRLGARMVSLPTLNAANELENVAGQRDESKLPYWMGIAREMQARGIAGDWIRVVDEQGARQPGRPAVLRGDGQLRHGAGDRPHRTARDAAGDQSGPRGRRPATADHASGVPHHAARHRPAARAGGTGRAVRALLYHAVYRQDHLGDGLRQHPDDRAGEHHPGHRSRPERRAPWPDEGLEIFIGKLLDAGFSEADVQRMVRDNPARLLGDEATG